MAENKIASLGLLWNKVHFDMNHTHFNFFFPILYTCSTEYVISFSERKQFVYISATRGGNGAAVQAIYIFGFALNGCDYIGLQQI